jgi:hypothetical protein
MGQAREHVRCVMWGLAVALSSAGCGTALEFVRTATPPYTLPSRAPGQVDLFTTSKPQRPFVEVGIVESQQEQWSLDSPQVVLEKMREYAGQLGCDGLVVFAGNDATSVSGSASGTTSRTLKGYRGTCIVYTPPPAVPRLASVPGGAVCIPNATQLCYGRGGCRGGQRCTEDGKAFTLCDCGAQAPPPTAAPPRSPSGGDYLVVP